MTKEKATRSNEAVCRLTRIGDMILEWSEAELDEDDRMIVFLHNPKTNEGGIAIGGYGDEGDMHAVADLFMHLKAIFEANGKTLHVTTVEPSDVPMSERERVTFEFAGTTPSPPPSRPRDIYHLFVAGVFSGALTYEEILTLYQRICLDYQQRHVEVRSLSGRFDRTVGDTIQGDARCTF